MQYTLHYKLTIGQEVLLLNRNDLLMCFPILVICLLWPFLGDSLHGAYIFFFSYPCSY